MAREEEVMENAGKIAAIDQMEATMRDHTMLLTNYYTGLLAAGCPEPLAGVLVVNWQQMFWQAAFGARPEKGN